MKKSNSIYIFLFSILIALFSCNTNEPEPVKLNVDNCYHCKMTIADLRFAAELITEKGRIYKFDDITCMVTYKKENAVINATCFVANYNQPEKFIKAGAAIYVSGGKVQSPMNGNSAAFADKDSAEKFASEKGATITGWSGLIND